MTMYGRPARDGRQYASTSFLAAVLGLLATGCASSPAAEAVATLPPASASEPSPAARSVLDGVYTTAQASRGEARFERSCDQCHQPTEFSGGRFRLKWSGQTVDDLYGFIATSMPDTDPGSLTPEQYADLVAYLLSLNNYPTGDSELPTDRALLSALRIEAATG